MMDKRFCKFCQVEHPLTAEHWYRLEGSPRCKLAVSAKTKKRHTEKREEILAYAKKWREENKERHKENNRQWREKNVERHRENAKKWYWNNRERALAKHAEYDRNRTKVDLNYRLAKNLRSRLHNAMRGGPKSTSAIRHLGCSIPELRAHLEARFTQEMNWDNYGIVWEIDHVRPLANYDLSNPEIAMQLCHYTNLQPLLVLENKRKSNKE